MDRHDIHQGCLCQQDKITRPTPVMSNEDALFIPYKYAWSETSDCTLQEFLTKVSFGLLIIQSLTFFLVQTVHGSE
jgi:hypothetical protein